LRLCAPNTRGLEALLSPVMLEVIMARRSRWHGMGSFNCGEADDRPGRCLECAETYFLYATSPIAELFSSVTVQATFGHTDHTIMLAPSRFPADCDKIVPAGPFRPAPFPTPAPADAPC
jgi:hypothetical protein